MRGQRLENPQFPAAQSPHSVTSAYRTVSIEALCMAARAVSIDNLFVELELDTRLGKVDTSK